MKRAIVIVVALGVLLIAGFGIFSQLRNERRAENERAVAVARIHAGGSQTSGGARRELQDPQAREALRLVGADAKAEEYWHKAINNPSLPPKEREDLIEDLNEVGFADPKHPTASELPLILKRIAIVEKLEAMDEVNAAAIREAHKDLTRMRDRLQSAATAP